MAYRILLAIVQGRVPLFLTPAIALEYQDVLLRPGVLALTGLTPAEALDIINELIALAHKVHLAFQWRPNLSDESDNKFVDAAIHGGAIIVTYNVVDYRQPDIPRHGWTAMTPMEFVSRHPIEEED
jgi:predicted nucleic acid-binding protein